MGKAFSFVISIMVIDFSQDFYEFGTIILDPGLFESGPSVGGLSFNISETAD